MGKERNSNWYDAQNKYMASLPLEKSPYLKLYRIALEMLPGPETNKVIADIGCGTGRFAQLLMREGYHSSQYIGFDFSPENIRLAQIYTPGILFKIRDVFDPLFLFTLPNFNVIVMLEFLEHITGDLDFVQEISRETDVIFSVPNYDSKAHVRYFENPEAVKERYAGLLDFKQEKMLPQQGSGKIFLFQAVRK